MPNDYNNRLNQQRRQVFKLRIIDVWANTKNALPNYYDFSQRKLMNIILLVLKKTTNAVSIAVASEPFRM